MAKSRTGDGTRRRLGTGTLRMRVVTPWWKDVCAFIAVHSWHQQTEARNFEHDIALHAWVVEQYGL